MIDAPHPSRHPSEAVLLSYAAGALALGHRLVVETHALACAACRNTVALLDRLGGVALEQAGPRPLPGGGLAAYMAPRPARRRRPQPSARPLRVGDIVLPAPLQGLAPGPLRAIAPGIRQSTLWRGDGSALHFIQVRAGVALPAHTHRGLELTCVLSGAFHDDTDRFAASDIAEEDESTRPSGPGHIVVAEPPEDCACLMATTGRLHFRTRLARLMQPFLPF